ncbi:unnamed protein product [Lymnaea stagnalis]|uniref:Peptidase S1 domain-containing protein n=1 Tax=Lymnaea stagnalis TaxID=6523 RepID=A0AAV2HQA4_LYMST
MNVLISKYRRFRQDPNRFPTILYETPNAREYLIRMKCGKMMAEKPQYKETIEMAPEKAWPWQVLVEVKNGSYCGGILIGDIWVLTPATCSDIKTLYFGVRNVQDKQAENVQTKAAAEAIIHDDFSQPELESDIALVRLDSAVSFTDHVKPICIPAHRVDMKTIARCHSTGWGLPRPGAANTPGSLKQLMVFLMRQSVCVYMKKMANWYTDKRNLCTETKAGLQGDCGADVGTPLSCIVDDAYFAIGMALAVPVQCETGWHPNVYLRISEFSQWILYNIEQHLKTTG